MGLLQMFSLILSSPPVPTSEDEQVEQVMRLINVLRDFDPAVYPAFEQASSKKKAIAFDYSADRVRELIRKNVNREGRTVFPHLGSEFGFFSSMSDDLMAGISFSVGATKWPGRNSFILQFPKKPSILRQEPPFTAQRVWDLFVRCTKAFGRPQQGRVMNSVNIRRFSAIRLSPDDLRPKTVEWINYFGPVVVDAIGRTRVESLPNVCPNVYLEEFEGGVFLRLLNVPLDDANPEHLEQQREVNRHLGLLGASVI